MRNYHANGPMPTGWRVGLWTLTFFALSACNDSSVSGPGNAATLPDQMRVSAAALALEEATLPARIKQALEADKSVDATAVSMSVENGQVVLNGTVPAEQITRIDAIVGAVAGVKIVINALRPIAAAS